MKDCCKDIEFGDSRIVYCSVCGQAHNKERLGKSMDSYAGHKGQTIFRRYTGGTLYFKMSNYNGCGEDFLNFLKMRPHHGAGVLDGAGGSMCFKSRSINLSSQRSGRGKGKPKGVDRVTFNHSFDNPKTEEYGGTTNVELSEAELFDLSDDKFNTLVINKAKPLFYKQITKEEFDTFEAKIIYISDAISSLSKFTKDK